MDYSKWNLKKIIYDPQWLADLFRCIVSLKNKNQIKDGIIEKKSIIDNIENEFEINDKETNKFLLTILEKFEIFITHPKKDNLFIIPFLMDSKKPIEIENEWNDIGIE